MALYKCNECGKMVTDKASVCPHCGNPIENILEVGIRIEDDATKQESSAQTAPVVNTSSQENTDKSTPESSEQKVSPDKGNGGMMALFSLLFLILATFIIIGISFSNKKEQPKSDEYSVVDSINNKFTIVIYSDNTGEFLNPQGGRICGVELGYFTDNWYEIDLTRKLDILGYSTYSLFVSGNYISSVKNFSDLSNDLTIVPVEIKDSADVRYFTFYLKEANINKQYLQEKPVDISRYMRNNYYLLVLYDGEENSHHYANGALYGPSGKRLCGISGKNEFREYYKFPKKITLLGDSTEEVYISNGYLYASYSDYYNATNANENVANKLKITQNKVGNATIITFANNPNKIGGSTQSASTRTTSTSTLSTTTSTSTTNTKTSDPVEELRDLLNMPDGIRFGNDKMQMTKVFYYSSSNEVEFKFTQYIFPKEAAEADPLLIPELTKSLIETRKQALRGITKLMNAMEPLKPKIRDILYYPDGTKCCEYTFEYSEI